MSPETLLVIVGRVLLGGLFVQGGIRHFFIMPQLTPMIAARGLPMPQLVLIAGSTFQIVVGTLLTLGLFVPTAALGLILFTVAASLMLLDFWNKAGPEREGIRAAFMTNIGLVGGLLVTAAVPG